jgi:hypothetical protein
MLHDIWGSVRGKTADVEDGEIRPPESSTGSKMAGLRWVCAPVGVESAL